MGGRQVQGGSEEGDQRDWGQVGSTGWVGGRKHLQGNEEKTGWGDRQHLQRGGGVAGSIHRKMVGLERFMVE